MDVAAGLSVYGHRVEKRRLRRTYICMHFMEGADIYQVATNCRTSVEMIGKSYVARLKHSLDAAAQSS